MPFRRGYFWPDQKLQPVSARLCAGSAPDSTKNYFVHVVAGLVAGRSAGRKARFNGGNVSSHEWRSCAGFHKWTCAINDGQAVHASGRLQIAACARFLWSLINAAFDLARMNKVFAQVRDVLQKNDFVTKRNMVEQNQMLVQLPHVADVRHDGNAKFATH